MTVTPSVAESVSQEDLRAWSRALYEAFTRPNASMSFHDCLLEANRAVESEHFRGVLAAVLDDVVSGNSLSRAMAKFPEVFDENYRVVVRYGEMYGELEKTMQRFADHPEEMFRPCRKPEA